MSDPEMEAMQRRMTEAMLTQLKQRVRTAAKPAGSRALTDAEKEVAEKVRKMFEATIDTLGDEVRRRMSQRG